MEWGSKEDVVVWKRFGTRLVVKADGTPFAGDNLKKLVELAEKMEQPLDLLERRGIDIRYLLKFNAGEKSRLPRYRVLYADTEKWFMERDEAESFLKSLQPVEPAPTEQSDSSTSSKATVSAQLVDLHEIKTLNDVFAMLKDYGFYVSDFTPAGLRNAEPVYPFALERDDDRVQLTSLRELLTELRRLGEKGLTVTRFKGLGEMLPEQLKQTTLDPNVLQKVYVRASSGQLVPLSGLATMSLTPGPVSVARQSQLPAVTLTFNLAPGYTLGEAVTAMEVAQNELNFPITIRGQWAGTAQVFQDSFRGQPLLITAAIITIYIVLGIQIGRAHV